MKKLGVGIILILIVVAGYFLIKKYMPEVAKEDLMGDIAFPTGESSPTIDASDLRMGGSSFSDPDGIYTFLYPNDYKIDPQDPEKRTRIYKTGATQKGQTEIYDGVIIVFQPVALEENESLSDWVDESIKTMTADGTSEVIEPKKAIMLNNYPGFSYMLRGLGTAQYYVLQKDTESDYAVVITTSVSDPEDVGFQAEVDKTLSTIEILK